MQLLRSRRLFSMLLLLAVALPPACSARHEQHSQVVLTVYVHDQDGYAWKGMEVRLVEAWNEWNASVCKAQGPWSNLVTDDTGEVLFDPRTLAAAGLGFQELPAGVAVVSSHERKDEATIRILVGHDTIGWVRVDVPVRFGRSHVEVDVQI